MWDQWCAFGQYQHYTLDGTPTITEFDASKCKATFDIFAAQKNDLFLDAQHEVIEELGADAIDGGDALTNYGRGSTGAYGLGPGDGRARAWYSAMVMVIGGQVGRYERHAGAPEMPPTLEDLRRAAGSLPEDGVYLYRAEVTPLGLDPKDGIPAYRYTSPFYAQAHNGWRAINLTATNDPRMDSVGLAMARGKRRAAAMTTSPPAGGQTPTENRMDPQIMAAAGCAEGDTPEQKLEKMAAYARKMTDDNAAMKAKMDAEHPDEEQDKKLIEEELKKKAAAAEASAKVSEAAKQAMQRENKALHAKLTVMEDQYGKLEKLLPTLEAQAAKSKEVEAEDWASSALAMGRYPADADGDATKTIAKLKAEYLADKDVAGKMLFAEGKFPRSDEAQAMRRLTMCGAGIDQPDPAKSSHGEEDTPSGRYAAAMDRTVVKYKAEIDKGADPDLLIKKHERAVWDAHWGAR